MDNRTLELQVKARAEEAITSVEKLRSKLTSMGTTLDRVTTKLDKDGKVISQSFSTSQKYGDKLYKTVQRVDKNGNLKTVSSSVKQLNTGIKQFNNNLTTSNSKISKFGSLFKNVFNARNNLSLGKFNSLFKNVFTLAAAKRIGMAGLEIMKEGMDYTEQLNLFNVVYGNIEKNGKKTYSELGKAALKYQHQLNEAFGTNMTETLYMQGIFQSMGTTSGIKDKYSAIMARTMTNMTYDLASLYNKSESDVAEAIRAGVYAG